MEKIGITIVGAGVVGLAVAVELSQQRKDIFVLEKESSFGEGISSRNSEVIHAGIYYPRDSLKRKTCLEGKNLLYAFCAKNNIPHKTIGKLIVAINKEEVRDLEDLFKLAAADGAEDLQLIDRGQIKRIQGCVEAEAAIYSPSTGILDSHGLMKNLLFQSEAGGVELACNTEVIAVDKVKDGFAVTVKDKAEGEFKFLTRIFINCAGLYADKIAAMVGLKKEEYRLKYCKGDYFRVNPRKAELISKLIYPVPKERSAGLGIHATLDLAGGLRLGPDDEYIQNLDYNVNPAKQKIFYESVRQFLPFIKLEDLSPDIAGIRPKLQGPQESFRDFIIQDEGKEGFPGFINLIGIESPGLTSALSIARIIKGLVENAAS